MGVVNKSEIELSTGEYARVLIYTLNKCPEDYATRMELAALLKQMEGDKEYAHYIFGVLDALEYAESTRCGVDKAKDVLYEPRKELHKYITKRVLESHLFYHNMVSDVAVATLPKYNPKEVSEGITRITLKNPTHFAWTESDICRLLGVDKMPSDDCETFKALKALDLPDHPERMIFREIVVPSGEVLKSKYIKGAFDTLDGGENDKELFDGIFGTEYNSGALWGYLRGCTGPLDAGAISVLRARRSLLHWITCPCFMRGGKYESEKGGGYVKEMSEYDV